MRKKGGRIYYSNRPGEWMENICSYIIWIYICLVFVRCKNYEILCRSNRHSCITAFATQSTLYCMYFVYCKLSWIVSLCLGSTSVCFSHFRIRRSSSPCSEPEHFIERRLSPNIIKKYKNSANQTTLFQCIYHSTGLIVEQSPGAHKSSPPHCPWATMEIL